MFSLISSIALFFGLILLFFWKRNNWVHKTKSEWNDIVYDYRKRFIEDFSMDMYIELDKLYSYDDMFYILPNYHKLLLMFWKNDMRSFVEPYKLGIFDEIINYKGKKEK